MKKLFTRPQFSLINANEDLTKGKIIISKLDRGFATTLGNAIRRILISSIESAAVVAVKIEGVNHEFEAIEKIEEDVVGIILNLKNLVLKIDSPGQQVLKAKINKEGQLKASDLVLPPGVEIISQDLVIANIAKGGSLEMEIYVQNGKGYATQNKNKRYTKVIGMIPIDSNYSPIKNVNYNVISMTSSREDLIEKLEMDIETNGSCTIKQVVAAAAQILIEHLKLLLDLDVIAKEKVIIEEAGAIEEKSKLDIPLEDLDLSIRSLNCLKRAGIISIGEISQKTRGEMQNIQNLGKKSLDEIEEKLIQNGLEFKK